MRLSNLEEGSFWGRDDLVKRMKDEEKAAGMKKFVKIDDDGNHHGVTTSDKEKWEELKAQGYKEDENYFNEAEVSVDNEGNIAGYLATIDEYVEMLFKSAEGTDNKKLTEIAYRIQNAVDDIRTRELGLKPSLIRAKFNETNVEEDIQDDRKYQSLEELRDKLEDITAHVRRLGIMDSATEIQGKPVTGTGDIHDQLITMSKSVQDLQGAVARALKVVPGEQNPDVQKFNKKAVGEVAKHGTTEYYRELDKGQLNHTKSMLMKSAGQLNVAIEQRYKFSKELMGNGDRAGTGDLQKMLDTLNHMISKWDEETKLYGK